MRKILFAAILLAASLFCANAQNYTRDGKQFASTQKARQSTTSNEKTGFTWKDSKGVVYDIYISSKNSCYIIKTSKKTGKQYRQYLPKEVSQQIASELGRDNTVDYE